MNHSILVMTTLVLVSATMASPPPASPYAGMEGRTIKAMPPEDASGYLAGEGMGFAMAAELNSYPGPKHVLELRDGLGLDEGQIRQAEGIFDEMHRKAVRLGERYVAKERELDELFAGSRAGDTELGKLVAEVAEIRGELRYAHLTAHLAMRRVLTEEQVSRYDELRGYRERWAEGHGEGAGPEAHTRDAHGNARSADCPHR